MIEYSIIRVKNQNLANELFLRIKEKIFIEGENRTKQKT